MANANAASEAMRSTRTVTLSATTRVFDMAPQMLMRSMIEP